MKQGWPAAVDCTCRSVGGSTVPCCVSMCCLLPFSVLYVLHCEDVLNVLPSIE